MSDQNIEAFLLRITREFLFETASQRALQNVSINSRLETDLGIDSLAKVELVSRIEDTLHVQLSPSLIASADSLQDLVSAIKNSKANIEPLSGEFTPALGGTQIDVSTAQTLLDVLVQYASHDPERPHIYLQDEDGKETIISYGELYYSATKFASGLIQRGIKEGESIALMLPTSNNFFYAFFGILLAGAIPVPIYPPFRPDRIEEYAKREVRILNNAEIRLLVTFTQAEMLGGLLKSFIPSLLGVVTPEELYSNTTVVPVQKITAEHPALIQYTSGSTGDPKGVLLLQQNIMANIRSIGKALQLRPTDAVISWLPLYHDMGLMSWLASLYYGLPLTIMSPLVFLNRPERWLWAIHYHRGSLTAGPNFAYELCVKKIDPQAIEGLDLSCWRLAFNGAEAVDAQTLLRFSKKFKAYGFNESALFPVYGLAENTVALAFPQKNSGGLRVDKISRTDFEKHRLATKVVQGDNTTPAIEFVCCGSVIPDHEIRIVDDNQTILPERHIGNLQFRGPSAMQGYYRNPAATEQVYRDGWWDSGDLAYLVDDEVYIIGRKKDIIIKAGRNINPEGIEAVVNQISGVRKGCVVAFGVRDSNTGTEKLVVAAETAITDENLLEKLQTTIMEQLVNAVGIAPDEIVLVKAKTIPKTSSGKLQRDTCKQAYIDNKLSTRRTPIYLQFSKLFLQSTWLRLRRFGFYSLRFLYSFYSWILFIITFLPIWLLVALLPKQMSRTVVKYWILTILTLIGCRRTITGEDNLRKAKTAIFAANHASYSDTLLLLTFLPENTTFVAKKELANNIFLRTFMKKFDVITLDRFDFSQNIADTARIADSLRHGNSILIFPEGTFSYATGLRPFKTGTFQLAVDTQTPICPIALAGTRDFLRSGSILIKPMNFKITIGEPIMPEGNDWQEVIKLRNLTKTAIAYYCGEATLDIITTKPVSGK